MSKKLLIIFLISSNNIFSMEPDLLYEMAQQDLQKFKTEEIKKLKQDFELIPDQQKIEFLKSNSEELKNQINNKIVDIDYLIFVQDQKTSLALLAIKTTQALSKEIFSENAVNKNELTQEEIEKQKTEFKKDLEIIKLLLDNGANKNVSVVGKNLLQLVIEKHNQQKDKNKQLMLHEILSLLLNKSDSPNKKRKTIITDTDPEFIILRKKYQHYKNNSEEIEYN